MNSYSTIRNTGLAAVLVAALAGVVSNGLALSQKIAYERDVLGSSSAVVLPEIVVVASRPDTHWIGSHRSSSSITVRTPLSFIVFSLPPIPRRCPETETPARAAEGHQPLGVASGAADS